MSLIFRDPSLHVFDAALLRVTLGANQGDPLGAADTLQAGDVFRLAPGTIPEALEAAPDAIACDACLTFMTPQGETLELLTLRLGARRLALPLGPLRAGVDLTLIAVDESGASARFAQSGCATFLRGTRITLPGGAQTPVEALDAGDLILTRDEGAQPVLCVDHLTARASGPFAPVRITAGALNNARDLVVAPDHRLFVYQRSDRLGAGRAELLIRARHLIDGAAIQQQSGGYVDYVMLRFARPQIVFAEGIGVESQRASPWAGAQDIGAASPQGLQRFAGIEASAELLEIPDRAETLRRASKR